MRSRFLLVVLALATLPGGALATKTKVKAPVRCCVELKIPDLPPGPVCAELSARRPRLACRLIGGRPVGRGDCSPAVCTTK
jgi:hypothetical protein